jgi:hypothetical protein
MSKATALGIGLSLCVILSLMERIGLADDPLYHVTDLGALGFIPDTSPEAGTFGIQLRRLRRVLP